MVVVQTPARYLDRELCVFAVSRLRLTIPAGKGCHNQLSVLDMTELIQGFIDESVEQQLQVLLGGSQSAGDVEAPVDELVLQDEVLKLASSRLDAFAVLPILSPSMPIVQDLPDELQGI
jgi:hypothetical protein